MKWKAPHYPGHPLGGGGGGEFQMTGGLIHFSNSRKKNACTLVPTVFRWHKKMEFKFHFYFSFFFGLVKWNSISISIFRFLSTCDIEKRIWISFFVFRFRRTLKRGFEFRFLFFVFSSLWKTDLNFVFCVSFSHHLENGFQFHFSYLRCLLLKNRLEFFAWIWKVD